MYCLFFVGKVLYLEVYIFFDVFKEVVVVVVYLKVFYEKYFEVGFFFGKVKVVFLYGYIILRFELCVLVLVVEMVEII